jgi:chaperonin GroES
MTNPDQIIARIDNPNLASDLDKDKLIQIGNEVVDGYDADKKSRADWEKSSDEWMKLAIQVAEKKSYPWSDASNVKFPLIAIAAMQFSARAYPSLVPQNGNIVTCKVVGYDPQGQKAQRAERIGRHMSYQLMEEMEEWEEDMDKLLLATSILGVGFKKTYFCPKKGRNVSKYIHANDLVINNWTRQIEDAERITEVLYKTKRNIKEMQLRGLYRDVDLGEPTNPINVETGSTGDVDETTPYTILEQHCFIDMDDDGYAEPYIVTVDYTSRQVLRIVACYKQDGVMLDEDGKVVEIKPVQYYTKFGAIPNPTGSFYDIGFGHLLGPINESVNTLINQLVDAGSLSNLQSGFLGKGLRVSKGESRFRPGEWKSVNVTGDDIKKHVFALPVREPSNVLFQLLGMLVTSGKELASVAEIMVGKMPGQNTPAYTTKETVEQGMKLFTAIYKRIYRSLKSEFRKLYRLNKQYLDPQVIVDVLDMEIPQSDYEGSENDIIPSADPAASSSSDKFAKVQQIFPLVQLGTINVQELTKRAVEAQEQPNAEALLQPPPQPQPDPKVQAMQMKAQIDGQKAQVDMAKSQQEMQIKEKMAQLDMQIKMFDLQIKKMEAQMEFQTKQMEQQFKIKESEMDLGVKAIGHQQQMKHDEEMFSFKRYEAEQKAKQAAEPKVREPRAPKPKK